MEKAYQESVEKIYDLYADQADSIYTEDATVSANRMEEIVDHEVKYNNADDIAANVDAFMQRRYLSDIDYIFKDQNVRPNHVVGDLLYNRDTPESNFYRDFVSEEAVMGAPERIIVTRDDIEDFKNAVVDELGENFEPRTFDEVLTEVNQAQYRDQSDDFDIDLSGLDDNSPKL